MQLVAYGAQDVFLTGNPQITFFKIVYRRHTNFAVESIEQTFNGTADFSRKVSCTISRNGDLITKMYLRVTLSGGDSGNVDKRWAWVSRVGHALIDNVELEVGGTRIDKQYGDWLNIWFELARNFAQDRGYNKLIGNVPELTTLAQTHNSAVLYVPLKFFCNRHDGLAIPLIALQYHETKVNFEFRPVEQCVNAEAGLTDVRSLGLRMEDATLYVDYVYLDNEERKRFAQAQHEYLIEQVQFTGEESVNSLSQKFRLNFNHPCKALYWGLKLGRYTTGKTFFYHDPSNVENTRVEATKRFVLACALYDNNGKLDLANNRVQAAVGLSASLAAKLNSISAVAITTEPDVDNITILGSPLSLEDVSTPVVNLLGNTPRPTGGDGRAAKDVRVFQWDNYGMYLDRSGNPLLKALLQLNGHDRFSERDGNYFNYVQPLQHHTNTPADGVNMYSFALNPEEHQPSGTCNMSRIDNATLNLTFGASGVNDFKNTYLSDDSKISIYASNYNVFRVMSGMGGLAYSN